MKRVVIANIILATLALKGSSARAGEYCAHPAATARSFLQALQDKNLPGMSQLMTDEVRLAQPLTLTPQPATYVGRATVEGYIGQVMAAFSTIFYSTIQLTEAKDGRSVFSQMVGNFVVAANGNPYDNIYVMRLDFQRAADGTCKVAGITEYFNPVIVACSLNATFAEFCDSIGR